VPLHPLTLLLSVGPLVYPAHSVVEPLALIVTVGDWLTVTVMLFDVTLHPPHVTTSVYVYVPALKPVGTVYVEPVAPLIALPLSCH
jgi:hypothetical protein